MGNKFKIGDRVRLICHCHLGQTGTVCGTENDCGYGVFYDIWRDINGFGKTINNIGQRYLEPIIGDEADRDWGDGE